MQLETIKKILKNPVMLLYFLDKKRIITLPDRMYLKLAYKNEFNKKLNLKNPQTFNEKLQWLKLYNRKDIYTTMVDKYEAKQYVGNIIGEEYIIPTIGIYNKFEDIDFDKLPNQFVLKPTHTSGNVYICKDKSKINYKELKKEVNKWLKRKYYYYHREWPYKNVKPRIIIEKYMQDGNHKDIKDYKFFCFNRKVKFFKIDFDRYTNHRANYYDLNKQLLHFGEKAYIPDYNKKLDMSINFERMIEFSEKLANGINFLRVDFYEINNKLYFGEITFYPAAGFGKFIPEEYDKILGDMLELPKEKIEK